MTLSVQSSGSGVYNGSYAYSWPSYNPGDINVSFSPSNASLTQGTSAPSQAKITASPNVSPGQYMLAVGFDAGTIRVWTFVQTAVVAQTPIVQMITSNVWLFIGVIVVIVVVVVEYNVLRRRKRESGSR